MVARHAVTAREILYGALIKNINNGAPAHWRRIASGVSLSLSLSLSLSFSPSFSRSLSLFSAMEGGGCVPGELPIYYTNATDPLHCWLDDDGLREFEYMEEWW